MIHVIGRGHVVDKDLHAEAGAVGNEQHPHAVVGGSGDKAGPAAFLAAVDGDAACAQILEVALRAVLCIAPVQHCHDQHQHTRYQQRQAPAHGVAHAQHQHATQQQRHQRLRRATAGIAPTGGCRVGGAHHIGREHHRGVVLRDHEARAHRADQQAEEQERLVALRHRHAQHGDRTQREQAGVGAAGTEAVAQRADGQPHENGHGHRGDIDIGDLVGSQAELALEHRHQRSAGEPCEEAHEESHPRQVEGAHLRGAQA